MRKSDLESDTKVFDLRNRDSFTEEHQLKWRPAGSIPASQIEAACVAYNGGNPLSAKVRIQVSRIAHPLEL
jgi:hypothetical protein